MVTAARVGTRPRPNSTHAAQLSLAQDEDAALPAELAVRRSDPVYNAHAYLTKVPYTAIVPFIERLTQPGDVVLDVFAGSGMTGVAAMITGRRAELRDISVLGRHIGTGYLLDVDHASLEQTAAAVVAAARRRLGDVYAVRCDACERVASLSKTVWSYVYECPRCASRSVYYEQFREAGWRKGEMRCAGCEASFEARSMRRVDEVPVRDFVRCGCSGTLREQEAEAPLVPASLRDLHPPDVKIGSERQMFRASALGRHGLMTIASFYSQRNLAVLTALNDAIRGVEDLPLQQKLTFAFTAVLTRASKRYQWHPKRPLNASNQNYYIAPVFYEWNVYELFERKVKASLRSDAFIQQEMASRGVPRRSPVHYELGSADALDLPDGSVDYVFTDPPFGSQIFYSDMNLFQEAWLGEFTDSDSEAVIDRARIGAVERSADRYERLMIGALIECRRVLKRDGRLSLVFSNSNGAMWLLVQRAMYAAGFALEHVTLLDKGQRSVKGLASGFESIVTADLVLTMRKASAGELKPLADAPDHALDAAMRRALAQPGDLTPTRIYLWVITEYLRNDWKVDGVTVAGVRAILAGYGMVPDPATGVVRSESPATTPAPASNRRAVGAVQ